MLVEQVDEVEPNSDADRRIECDNRELRPGDAAPVAAHLVNRGERSQSGGHRHGGRYGHDKGQHRQGDQHRAKPGGAAHREGAGDDQHVKGKADRRQRRHVLVLGSFPGPAICEHGEPDGHPQG